ncbi:SDR family NAD(P)-dependent oxidoreductase [uncultured Roseobacter sp.]|uniref:SDR family NAD(P)-dependent oxidoreductase n=1 Tax=uncultured Roseobacter sp. TaxID=114847 RepID=UPI002631EFE5|nr:SDR family NAD(P)-dependent oxidoreductase [uncultured Roseobacter sp.]
MENSTSKTAVVTGASRGIGAVVARRLASDGLNVLVNYAGSETAAQRIVEDSKAAGGSAIAVKADVSDVQAVMQLFPATRAAFGGVDVLVNNAGIMKPSTLADSDDTLFHSRVAVNLKGSFNTLRAAAHELRDGGTLVNFSSSVVGLKLETYGVYAGIKAAVETMTSVLTKNLRGRTTNVNANALA